jgi:anti-anti-sigma regulatory factor
MEVEFGDREAANGILSISSAQLRWRTVICLAGAVDLESTPRLDRQFAEAARFPAEPIILDMSELRRIDEAAVSSVLLGLDKLRALGAQIEVHYPSPMALQLFELCSQADILGIEFVLDPEELPKTSAGPR